MEFLTSSIVRFQRRRKRICKRILDIRGTISRAVLDLADPTIPNGCRTHLSSLVINVKILAKHGSHRLATEYRLLNTKEQLTNGRLLSAILFLASLRPVHGRSLFGITHYSGEFLFLFLTIWFLPFIFFYFQNSQKLKSTWRNI